jgi:hypothetical protein
MDGVTVDSLESSDYSEDLSPDNWQCLEFTPPPESENFPSTSR